MNKKTLENKLQVLELEIKYFNLDKLFLQLEQLNQKIKIVEQLPDLKKHTPVFLLKQSCDNHVKQ